MIRNNLVLIVLSCLRLFPWPRTSDVFPVINVHLLFDFLLKTRSFINSVKSKYDTGCVRKDYPTFWQNTWYLQCATIKFWILWCSKIVGYGEFFNYLIMCKWHILFKILVKSIMISQLQLQSYICSKNYEGVN